jgi:hypothetical protein
MKTKQFTIDEDEIANSIDAYTFRDE